MVVDTDPVTDNGPVTDNADGIGNNADKNADNTDNKGLRKSKRLRKSASGKRLRKSASSAKAAKAPKPKRFKMRFREEILVGARVANSFNEHGGDYVNANLLDDERIPAEYVRKDNKVKDISANINRPRRNTDENLDENTTERNTNRNANNDGNNENNDLNLSFDNIIQRGNYNSHANINDFKYFAGHGTHLLWLEKCRILGFAGNFYTEEIGGAIPLPLRDVYEWDVSTIPVKLKSHINYEQNEAGEYPYLFRIF